jgi:hypothetical protein
MDTLDDVNEAANGPSEEITSPVAVKHVVFHRPKECV